MGFDIKTDFGSAFDLVGKIIDKVFPDKDAADKAKLEMLRMKQDGDLKELDADLQTALQQMAVNIAEANSGSNFKGGWRPFAGWACGGGIAYMVILRPIATGVVRIWVPDFDMPPIDTQVLLYVLGGMLGLGGFRSTERIKAVKYRMGQGG